MNIEQKLLPSPGNYGKGRAGHVVQAIVVHIQEGTMAGTDSWFRDPDSKVSAHYGVSKDGHVVQWVRDEDAAWHAGRVFAPTAKLVGQVGGNPNHWTIGIENEGRSGDTPPVAQLEALAKLVAFLCGKHRLPLDRDHVVGHREIYAKKDCPGSISVDAVVARALLYALPSAPAIGDRRWSPFFGEYVYVTGYVSDADWKFITESELRKLGEAAQSPFSAFPEKRP